MVWRIRAGRLVALRFYRDRNEALSSRVEAGLDCQSEGAPLS
jgi:hypothetical protein